MDGDLHQQLQHLQARLDQVESRLASLEAAAGPAPAWSTAPPPVGDPLSPPPVGGPLPPPPTVAPGRRRGAPGLDTAALITWIGIGLVVLAAGFLVSTAISRGWLGPEAQLAGAFVIGALLTADGHRRSATNRVWGVPLATGGVAVLLVTAAASSAGVGVVAPEVASLWLALTAVVAVTVAWRIRAELVAVVATPLAAVLPLWIAEGTDLAVLLTGGLITAVAVGVGVVALAAGWTVARVCAVLFGGLALIAAVATLASPVPENQVTASLVAAGLVTALGWFGPVLARGTNPYTHPRLVALDHRVVLHIPVAAWLLVDASLPGRTLDSGMLACALAAGFAVVAAGLRRRIPTDLLATQLMGAMILLTVGLALATNGPTVLVALAIQAAALGLLARTVEDPLAAAQAVIYALVAAIWVGITMVSGLFDPLSEGQHLADLLVVLLIVAAAFYGHGYRLPALIRPAGLVGWVGALLWLADVVIHGPQGQVVVSGIWAAAAIGAVVVGVARAEATARVVGLVTLLVVVAKLLTIDLGAVDTLWRVGLFFVIGTGLLRLAYVLPRLSGRGDGGDDWHEPHGPEVYGSPSSAAPGPGDHGLPEPLGPEVYGVPDPVGAASGDDQPPMGP